MAWDSSALESYEVARLALDKPLIATQAIPVSPDYAKWVDEGQVAAGDITTWTDRSATANPARRAYDGFGGLVTKQSGTNDDVWYYCLDLGSLVAFDCAFVLGHNAGTIGADVTLEIADDNDYSTDLQEIGDFGSPADDSRLAVLDLNHGGDAQRYEAQFVRLKFDSGGGNITPEIGELILGRRRQLEYKPNRPFDAYALNETAITTVSAGIIVKTVYARRGFELAGDFLITSDTYRDDLLGFYRACRGPFVWIDNPSSAPSSYCFMVREAAPFALPEVVANTRAFHIAATEQGPESLYLDVEANG